jgi:uncharacterized membrane protein YgdD (TMEM256/DUF423 family)
MPIFIFIGGLSGGLSVALGAFAAHALQERIPVQRQETFETGARYQMYHSLAMLAAGIMSMQQPDANLAVIAGWAFLAGILLFSGSLYLLALTDRRWFGAITPFGGLAFILGWLLLALAAV